MDMEKKEDEDEDDSAEADDADNIDIDIDDNNNNKSTTIYFNPDMEITYADRIRRREPGDTSLGLSPHVDSGSIERWIETNYQNVYHDIFFGGSTTTSKKIKKDSSSSSTSSSSWIYDYNPFHNGVQHRVDVQEFPSPAVCSVFRTFQGWVALTPQGEGDGTLQLLPSTLAMPYMLLRAIQDDVPDDDLCGAKPGRALTVSPKWHSILLEGLVSIPKVNPGDTVWWHPDTIHAVEDKHNGEGYSNVLYVGAVPDCNKNRQFLNKQKNAFLNGKSCPDFAPEHHECTYKGRATKHDLTELGRRQMGFQESE